MQSFEEKCSAVARRAQNGLGRRSGEVPGFIGRKLLKRGFQRVFKNAHDLLLAEIGFVRGEAEFSAGLAQRGLALSYRFQRLSLFGGIRRCVWNAELMQQNQSFLGSPLQTCKWCQECQKAAGSPVFAGSRHLQ